MTDQQAYETAFIVNSSRQNLEPFEQGRWFTIMMETFPETYPSQRELADHVGLNQSTVSRHIAYYEAQTKSVVHHDANSIIEKQNEKNGLKEKSGIKQPDSEKTSFQKSAENAPSAENSLKQPDTTLHSIIVKEYVDRAIRASPPEIQEQLRREAEEKQFTVKQTQERANELAVEYYISLIPKSFQNRVRSIAERERKWGQDPLPLVKDIEMDFNLSLEDGIKLLQAETAICSSRLLSG
jgi:DNA-binding transcriptional regulator YhcF (GntR family)